MSEMLLKHNLKTLRLPTMLSEYAQLSREAADADENYEQYLLRLTELEVATRTANALAARICRIALSLASCSSEMETLERYPAGSPVLSGPLGL